MANDKDFKVKNGIKPTVYHEAVGTVVSATEGYDLAGASYDNKSFSVASQEGGAGGVQFKSDGTKMYVTGQASDSTFQYSLSTPYDVSTASYDSVSFNHTAQVSNANCYDLFFKTDGTQMYVMFGINDTVYQYTLSTAWDLSTASYASKNFSVASQESGEPGGLAFSNDGTKMYVVGEGQATVFQYTLSTAWDLSTASYASKSFSVSSKDTKPSGIAFSISGDNMFISGENTDNIYLFTLSTTFDVTTASFSESLDISAYVDRAWYVALANDGKKMYVGGIGTTGGVSNNTIYQYSTALITNTLDLSTGSVFEITPTSDIQVGLSNPAASGTVSQATLLLNGEESTGVGSKFSTTLYTGGTAQKINNNINFATDGGLAWIKRRNTSGYSHQLFDTERTDSSSDTPKRLSSDTTAGEDVYFSSGEWDWLTNGFDLNNTDANINGSGGDYVAWSFKKQAKFFDIVTYTGNGTNGRAIAHNLSSNVGSVIIKKLDATEAWYVWHRGYSSGSLKLNDTSAGLSFGLNQFFGGTQPTSSNFYVSSDNGVNNNGSPYVAYLFAHDTDASSIIKCGSFTTDGNGDASVNLGFEPQWVLLKRTDGAQSWWLADTLRGMPVGTSGTAYLTPDQQSAEDSTYTNYINPTATGFAVDAFSGSANYIYVVIRNPSVPTITYPSTLEFSGGTAPTSPAVGETDVITFSTTDGGTSYQAVQAIDGAK